jgi:hypothetical protein
VLEINLVVFRVVFTYLFWLSVVHLVEAESVRVVGSGRGQSASSGMAPCLIMPLVSGP